MEEYLRLSGEGRREGVPRELNRSPHFAPPDTLSAEAQVAFTWTRSPECLSCHSRLLSIPFPSPKTKMHKPPHKPGGCAQA